MKKQNLILLLIGLVSFAMVTFAGDLEPPESPDSTMHSLDDIYNRIDRHHTTYPARVEKTGQTTIYASGDDGDLGKGVLWSNPRFTDNGDSTVTDNNTGLMWLKEANCIGTNYPSFDNDEIIGEGRVTWQHALDFIAGINTGSYPNCAGGYSDWRLPNVKEIYSLLALGEADTLLPPSHPFTNVKNDEYWSSTTVVYSSLGYAWYVNIDGTVDIERKSGFYFVWPVRGGD